MGNGNGLSHGYYAVKALLNGGRLDRRTSIYRAISEKERMGGGVSRGMGKSRRVLVPGGSMHVYGVELANDVVEGFSPSKPPQNQTH